MYQIKKMANYTEQEVCNRLNRPSVLTAGGVETMFLSDRLEPWLCLFRPFSHNTAVRMYYWPECEI